MPRFVDALNSVGTKKRANQDAQSRAAVSMIHILCDLYVSVCGEIDARMSQKIATLAVLGILARFGEGYIRHEIDQVKAGLVLKKWRAMRKALVSDTPSKERRLTLRGAINLEAEFSNSVMKNERGAIMIANEMRGICLALCIEYAGRHGENSKYSEAQNALKKMIDAFEQTI